MIAFLLACSGSGSDPDASSTSETGPSVDLGQDSSVDLVSDAAIETAHEGDIGEEPTKPIVGFGDLCNDEATPPLLCATDSLECAYLIEDMGFCTTTCTEPDALCPGAPAGTLPLCGGEIERDDGTVVLACVFVCAADDMTFDCPEDLECNFQVELGLKVCAPPND
jgi:hypothetical protein